MKPRSHSQLFAVALCVLALFVVQIPGSRAGYVCLCGGKPVPTQTSHCHGPHGEKCHASDAENGDSHHEENSGDREDHQVVNQDVQMRPVDAKAQVFAPQVWLAMPRVADFVIAVRVEKVSGSYLSRIGESPPAGVAVARTIVLLI